MDIKAGMIPDLLIAPSGKCYSKTGLQRLLAALFSDRVDDQAQDCMGCRYGDAAGGGDVPPVPAMP